MQTLIASGARSQRAELQKLMPKKSQRSLIMPLTETELLARDAKRNIGDELLQAIRDVKAGNMGAQYSVMPNEIVEAGVKCGQNTR